MPRYIVERTFNDGFRLSLDDLGVQACAAVVATNAKSFVTWVHSYVSSDRRKTFCVYDAPSPDAIREAAQSNNLPIDTITAVSVLDPYFYHE